MILFIFNFECLFPFFREIDPLIGIPEEPVDQAWAKIGRIPDGEGQPKYSILANIMKGLAVIPHSNASSERVFSLVRKNKTEARASMSRELLSAIIGQKTRMISRGQVCHTVELDKALLTKAKAWKQ